MRNIYRRLLMILATATQRELARHVRYLQIENRILRDRLPKRIALTIQERNRLVRFGSNLGKAMNELVTIVHPNTLRRWIRENKRNRIQKVARGRRPTALEVRRLILRFAKKARLGVNIVMHDRDTKFTTGFDAKLTEAGAA